MEATPVKKATRVQRSESEIRAMLKEQEESNVTVKEFCEIYGMHEATLYNWRKKYNPKSEKPEEFIALQINETGRSSSLFAEIELPGKVMIRLFQKVDPSYFKALL
jgi:transposase-like protein